MLKKGVNLRIKADLHFKNYAITHYFILWEKFISFSVICYFYYKNKYVKDGLIPL